MILYVAQQPVAQLLLSIVIRGQADIVRQRTSTTSHLQCLGGDEGGGCFVEEGKIKTLPMSARHGYESI